jgi:hypothetical protein
VAIATMDATRTQTVSQLHLVYRSMVEKLTKQVDTRKFRQGQGIHTSILRHVQGKTFICVRDDVRFSGVVATRKNQTVIDEALEFI